MGIDLKMVSRIESRHTLDRREEFYPINYGKINKQTRCSRAVKRKLGRFKTNKIVSKKENWEGHYDNLVELKAGWCLLTVFRDETYT